MIDSSVTIGLRNPGEIPAGSVDDPDPYVFGPPGSESVSTRSRSGSGSFYHQAKIVRKTLIPTVLWLLYDFLSLKNDVNLAPRSNKQKNTENIFFDFPSWSHWPKKHLSEVQIPRSVSIPKFHRSATLPAGHVFLKVPSHQFRSAWKWYAWIGLHMYVNRGW